MLGSPLGNAVTKTTSYKVVVPFYAYAAVAFLLAALLLLLSTPSFTGHHFQPRLLAITHIMALGWGTMVILGASHQLFPVLIEADLYSERLARASFWAAALGIPLLVHGFLVFNLGLGAQIGGVLVLVAVLFFLLNIARSMARSKRENVHAVFVFTAVAWLALTVLLGLALLFNFTASLLPRNSLYYLALHAHLGIVGWFLLLVLGVGSRLIPLFLISKYSQPRLLWAIYFLVNSALLAYLLLFLYGPQDKYGFLPWALVVAALLLFVHYCRRAYQQRIRRKVDDQMKVSLLSIGLMFLPSLVLMLLMGALAITAAGQTSIVLLYGFTIFFGWLTAIILGMTFKTLPFIIWNKVFRPRAFLGKMPGPKDLFSDRIFRAMAVAYLAGFCLFAAGIMAASAVLLKAGAAGLLLAAALYNWNVFKLVAKKPYNP